MDATELEALYGARRYRDLARALGAPSADEELGRARLRARLFSKRWAPVLDVVEAADRLGAADDPDAPDFTARAVRALARAGASRLAHARLDEATARWPEHPALALARAQLETGELESESAEEHAARLAMRGGDLAGARAIATRAVEQGDVSARAWALRVIVDLARGEREFSAAAEAFAQLAADVPEAFDAPLLEACSALCRWAAGDAAALEALRAVRERARGGRGELRTAFDWCTDVLDRVDRDPERRDAGPRWTFAERLGPLPVAQGDAGAAAVRVVLRGFGAPADDLAPCPDMATLRFALQQRAIDSLRLVATPARIEAALAEGALVVVEEERSTRTAFLLVVGVEPTAGLLLVHEPSRGGAYLTTFAEQRARAALFGGSGLVALGPADASADVRARLVAREVIHDARLDAVDACDLDPRGQVPPRARVDVLAREAIELAPELPTPHRRHGEAMLEQLRVGRLGGGRLERWVAVTREKFPRAEWALQTYAQALEIWGRPHEAGVAWADAQALDDWDHRNTLGRARAHLRMGQPDQAEAHLRRTLSLDVGHPEAMARWAELLLERGELARARVLSEIAEDIAPEDRQVLHARATVLEQEDRFDDALARLTRVAEADPRDSGTRARCLKRLFHAGRWDESLPVAEAMVKADPGDPYNWGDLAFVRYARGEAEPAVEAVVTGLARCGPERVLVDEAARILATVLDEAGRAAFIARLDQALAARPLSLMDIAVELTRRKLDEDGVALALRANELMPGDANGPWRAAQTLLALPHERAQRFARIEGLLRETISRAGRYPHPRVVLALTTLASDPEGGRALLEEADVGSGPVLVWKALSLVHGALGNGTERARVDERLAEVGPDPLVDAATFLRNVGLAGPALELLDAALTRAPRHARARVERARTLLREGDVAGAAAEAEPEGLADVFVHARVALASRDWPTAVAVVEPEVRRVTRRSAGGAYDGWLMRARLAGAKLALGEAGPADHVRARAGRHAEAMAALLSIARAAELETRADAGSELASFAPGAALTLERGGVRW